jgi:hypothetical protein
VDRRLEVARRHHGRGDFFQQREVRHHPGRHHGALRIEHVDASGKVTVLKDG